MPLFRSRNALSWLFGLAFLLVIYFSVLAQTPAKTAKARVKVETIAPRPEDVATLDGIIKAFYETISGPQGQPRHQQYSAFLRWQALVDRLSGMG